MEYRSKEQSFYVNAVPAGLSWIGLLLDFELFLAVRLTSEVESSAHVVCSSAPFSYVQSALSSVCAPLINNNHPLMSEDYSQSAAAEAAPTEKAATEGSWTPLLVVLVLLVLRWVCFGQGNTPVRLRRWYNKQVSAQRASEKCSSLAIFGTERFQCLTQRRHLHAENTNAKKMGLPGRKCVLWSGWPRRQQ